MISRLSISRVWGSLGHRRAVVCVLAGVSLFCAGCISLDALDSGNKDGGSSDGSPPADASPPGDAGTDAKIDVDGGSINDGLVIYYKFDETSGTSCADSTGNPPGTLVGATFAPGLDNNALTLSGNDQYVNLPSGIVGNLTSFSISVWVNVKTSSPWSRIFDFGTGPPGPGTGKYMYLSPKTGTAPATMRFAITTNGNVTGVEQRVETSPLATGSWEHVVITVAGGTGILYVGGAQVATQAITLTPNDLIPMSQLCLGKSEGAADPYLDGQIDNFRIYNRGLSADEVKTLFQLQE